MKGAGFGVIIAVAIVVALSLFFAGQMPAETDERFSCASDSDCVPARCCHADSAVSKNFAPDCKGTFCTMNCAPNTLDCGQGAIKCIKNKCEVILK